MQKAELEYDAVVLSTNCQAASTQMREPLRRSRERLAGITEKVRASASAGAEGAVALGQKLKQSQIPESTRLFITAKVEEASAAATKAKSDFADGLPTTSVLVNTLLTAPEFSRLMSEWLNALVESAPTVYDRSADAAYTATHIGGGNHRLFDGSHTLWDMWDKVHDTTGTDTFLQEIHSYTETLLKDVVTPNGLPFFNLNRETYNELATFLAENLSIPREWLYDVLTFNGAEVIGSTLGILAVALNWNKGDVELMSTLAGSFGVSAIAAANPLLAIVVLVALARALFDARKQGNYASAVDGLVKGGLGTGAFIATAAVIGGPVWVGIVLGFVVAVLVHNAMGKISVVDIIDFIRDSALKKLPQLPALTISSDSTGEPTAT